MELAVTTSDNRQSFKSTITALRELNAEDLARVNAAIVNQMDSPVQMIPELAGHLVNAGGKRLRPLLTLASARIFSYNGDGHIWLATAVELIHGATLLHDDVVDNSKLRRGLQTANARWGNKESILVGDFIFSRAFELMVRTKNIRVLQILSRASSVIAEGEVLQLATQRNMQTTYEMYLSVVKAKTAALFGAAAEVGAVVAGAHDNQIEALRAYGLNLGIAYQLIDDALDYAGTGEALGKAVGDDFREGKMTLPVVLAIHQCTCDKERAFWQRIIVEDSQTEDDLAYAIALMDREGVIEETLAIANGFVKTAIASLDNVPYTKQTQILIDVAAQSVTRLY